jgi:hypothetical protein
MTPSFVLVDSSCSSTDLNLENFNCNPFVVNGLCDYVISDLTEVSPVKPLPYPNLFMWTIDNGFKMFENADAILIKRSSFKLSSKNALTILNFVYSGEKVTDLAVIDASCSSSIKTDHLYEETSKICLDCILITRRLYNDLKQYFSDDFIFSQTLTDDGVSQMIARTGKRMLKIKG